MRVSKDKISKDNLLLLGCSGGLPRRWSQPARNIAEALVHPKTIQNANDVVQKSISQVSEAKNKGQRPKIESEGPKTKAQRPKSKAQNPKTKAQRQSLSGPRLPKTIQNADDVVQKSISQVSETKTKVRRPKIEG